MVLDDIISFGGSSLTFGRLYLLTLSLKCGRGLRTRTVSSHWTERQASGKVVARELFFFFFSSFFRFFVGGNEQKKTKRKKE